MDLQSNRGVQKNNLTFSSLELQKALSLCKQITFINLSGNLIGTYGIQCLSEGVGHVISLNISSNGLNSKHLPYIMKLLKNSFELKELDLSLNEFGNEICTIFAKSLAGFSSIQRIYIRKCGITGIAI